MEYLPGLPHDTKPLRSFSGNWVKMLLKSHLGIKCHTQYNKVIRLHRTVLPMVNASDGGCIVHDLKTIIVLVFLAFNFTTQRSQHSLTTTRSWLRNSATVTLREGGTSNSDAGCISETKVSEHNSMSYCDDAMVRSLRFPARPRTLLQSSLQTVGTRRHRPGLVSTSRNRSLRQA